MKKPFAVVTNKGSLVGSDILNQYAIKEASNQLKFDSFQQAYGEAKLVTPLYNPESLTRLLEMNTYHMRCCKTKARDTAGLGFKLESLTDSQNETGKTKLAGFFDDQLEPLPLTLDRVMYDYEVMGYAALELVRVRNGAEEEPANMFHLPAHTLRRHTDGVRVCQIRGNKKRWYKMAGEDVDIHKESGEKYDLGSLSPEQRASEIIWFMNYTARSDYYGMPDVIPVLSAIYGDISRSNYNIAFFENYGVPAYAVFITGDYDEGEIDENGRSEFEKVIEDHFRNMKAEPHSTLILSIPSGQGGDVKVNFEPLSLETKEASFRLYRKDNRDEVLSAHAVPPYRAGIAETGSLGGSTAEESTEIYKTSVIEPRQEMLENAINLHIVKGGFDVHDWEFKLADIDNTDEMHDLEMVKGLFSIGAITPNQIINHFGERFGLTATEGVPHMDMHFINNVPVETLEVSEAIDATLKQLNTVMKRMGE